MSDIVEAATSGDARATLEAARDHLAAAIAVGPGNQHLPNLVGQLRAVLADIQALPDPIEVSTADEIAARRASRRGASPADPARAKRPG